MALQGKMSNMDTEYKWSLFAHLAQVSDNCCRKRFSQSVERPGMVEGDEHRLRYSITVEADLSQK